MIISFTKKAAEQNIKRDARINPHRFWIFFVGVFIALLTIEIVYFTYLFVMYQKRLDTPVAPELNTNSAQIKKIEQTIKKTEDAVSTRTGKVSTPALGQ